MASKSKSAHAAAVPQPAIAKVALDPNGFVDVINTPNDPGDGRLCSASVLLQLPAPDNIAQDPSTGTLIVKADMKIDFVMTDANHKLAGIAFRRVRGSGPGNGSNNMPKDRIKIDEDPATNTTTLHMHDTYANQGPKNTWVWDIVLVVQDNSGAVGLIDPDIENQD